MRVAFAATAFLTLGLARGANTDISGGTSTGAAFAAARRSPVSRGQAVALDAVDSVPRFALIPTAAGRPATGWVEITPSQSPFGIAVSREGRITYDLTISAADLPPASTFGNYSIYEAWVTTPKLDPVIDLGTLRPGDVVRGRADWNKFTVIISAEASPPVRHRWTGPVLLLGRSPSSLMQSFVSHPLYSVPEPD